MSSVSLLYNPADFSKKRGLKWFRYGAEPVDAMRAAARCFMVQRPGAEASLLILYVLLILCVRFPSFLFFSLFFFQAIWNEGDGSKYYRDDSVTEALISGGVSDLRGGGAASGIELLGAFFYCVNLKIVSLPESLRRVGTNSFSNCRSLLQVHVPAGVSELGASAFSECFSLKTVALPEGIVHLPRGTFFYCKSLESVDLPSSLRTIGYCAFSLCCSLGAINFESLGGVTEIDEAAFRQCASLTTFKFPPLMKKIERCMLQRCSKLSRVDLPPSLEVIQSHAFCGCHQDLLIDLPETVRNVGAEAFYGCQIRLPPSLSMLRNGTRAGNSEAVRKLLDGVTKVVLSSEMSLRSFALVQLTDLDRNKKWLKSLRRKNFLHNVKIRVLHGGSCPTAVSASPFGAHIPESFFSFDTSGERLMSLYHNGGEGAFFAKVESAFVAKLSTYADVLKVANLPEESLSDILPFIYGDEDFDGKMLGRIVGSVKKLFNKK